MYSGDGEPLVQGLGWAQAPQSQVGCMSLKGPHTARPSEDVLYSAGPLEEYAGRRVHSIGRGGGGGSRTGH